MAAVLLLVISQIIASIATKSSSSSSSTLSSSSDNTNYNYNSIKRNRNESLAQQLPLDCNKLFHLWLRLEHSFPLLAAHLSSKEIFDIRVISALNEAERILHAPTSQNSALLSQKSALITRLESNPTYSRIIHKLLQNQAKQSNQEHHQHQQQQQQQQMIQFQVAPELAEVENPQFVYGRLVSHPNSREFDSTEFGNGRTLSKLRKLSNEHVTQPNELEVGVWRSADEKIVPDFGPLTGEF